MFSSVERKEEAVSCEALGLCLLAFSDLDSKSVPHKHACAHMQLTQGLRRVLRVITNVSVHEQRGTARCAVDLDNSC